MPKGHTKGHTSAHKNKRFIVSMRNESNFVDTFIETSDRFITFKTRGRVPVKDIRAVGVYKEATPSST